MKNICFQFFPLGGGEKRADEWNKCTVAIDESHRRLKNKPRKTKSVVDETGYESHFEDNDTVIKLICVLL